MRILLITDLPWGEDESAVEGLFRHELRAAHEVEVVFHARGLWKAERRDGVVVVPKRALRHGLWRALAGVADTEGWDCVIVRNKFHVLRQALRCRGRCKVGFWESFPHAYRRVEDAVIRRRGVWRKRLEFRLKKCAQLRMLRRADFFLPISRHHEQEFYPGLGLASDPLPMGVDRGVWLGGRIDRCEGSLRLVYTGTLDSLRGMEVICRAAAGTLITVYWTVSGRPDAIQAFGQLVHWHSHILALVTEGVFLPDGTFLPLPELAIEPFLKRWDQEVFALLLAEGRITEEEEANMRSWKHSGFSVDQSVRLQPGDQEGVQRLIEYFLRCPFSQARGILVTEAGKVIYKTEHNAAGRFPDPGNRELLAGPARNFQVFDPLDFLAEVTQHIPDPGEHLIRYYGWYSNRTRGQQAQWQLATVAATGIGAKPPTAGEARQGWVALSKQVYEADPLSCPKCGSAMKIIACIERHRTDVIEKILHHCGLWEESPARSSPMAAVAVAG